MARSPVLPKHVHHGLWLLFVPFTVALILLVFQYLGRNDPLPYRLQQQTIANAQNQAKLKANHLSTVGPPAAEISKGNATAVPTRVAPTTPAPTYTVAGPSGATGQQGPGPTDAQVQTAVGRYFHAHPVRAPVSAAQLTADAASYVARYLRTHPAPAGKTGGTGPSGVPGEPGVDGSPGPSGAQGPAPTDAQIATAVQQYLPGAVAAYLIANPPAAGPAGSTGPSGPSGASGPPGETGAQGETGATGPPIASWSWTDPDTGVVHVCTRSGGTVDAPTYSCTSETPAGPSDTATP